MSQRVRDSEPRRQSSNYSIKYSIYATAIALRANITQSVTETLLNGLLRGRKNMIRLKKGAYDSQATTLEENVL
jgi:hypothetical protein